MAGAGSEAVGLVWELGFEVPQVEVWEGSWLHTFGT